MATVKQLNANRHNSQKSTGPRTAKGKARARLNAFQALRDEYQELFDTCAIRPERETEINRLVRQIEQNRRRYEDVSRRVGAPWYFIGAVHCLEASLSFKKHLHNGDPLTARTVQVPKGRPSGGEPPFTWEQSAEDALRLKRIHTWTDWTVPGILYKLEEYNGFGYRMYQPEVRAPYLWSFSNHYMKGKYVADGTYSSDAVSKQCGCAVILRRMAETGAILFDRHGVPAANATAKPAPPEPPRIRYSRTKYSAEVEELQRTLNRLPGIFLKVDGVPGDRTSDVFRRLTGHYLAGDPREVAGTVRRG